MSSPLLRKSWLVLFVVLLSSCGGGGGGAKDEAAAVTPPAPLDVTGTVFGKVLDSDSEAPLVGATVKAGGKTAVTGQDGAYVLENLALARTVVVVTAAGHAEQTAIVTLNANQGRQQVLVRALRVGTTRSFDAAVAQTLTDTGSAAQVVLPAAALVAANGTAPVGAVTAEITGIDPGSNPGAMPGDYRTVSGLLQSFGAVTVSFRDAAGQPLNLAAGKTATLRIPVASGLAVLPATSPLYAFDTASGLWVRDGQATLVGSGAGAYYEGVVSHFSTWNADDLINTVQVTGRVTNETGTGLAGVTVGSVGVGYAGFATVVSNANGNFSLPMRANATAEVLALLNEVESSVQRVTAGSTDLALPAALVLPSAAAARLSLGTPAAVENLGITPNDCCRYFNVRVPFSTNGLRLPYPAQGNRVDARWEIRHRFAQQLATPEVVCRNVFGGNVPGGEQICTVDGVDGVANATAWRSPYLVGDYGVARVDNGTSATSGVVEFFFSAHVGGYATDVTPASITFSAVLAVDVTDPVTGRTVTVRSEARQVTVPLR